MRFKTQTQRNQSNTEGPSPDSGHQTSTADHDLRVRTQQEGTETKYRAFKNIPYFYQENGCTMCWIPLNIIPGLKECPHLQNIRDDCAKVGVPIPDLAASEPVTIEILTPQQYIEQEQQGHVPQMKIHEMMQFLAETMQDTTTQVISVKFNQLELQPKQKSQ